MRPDARSTGGAASDIPGWRAGWKVVASRMCRWPRTSGFGRFGLLGCRALRRRGVSRAGPTLSAKRCALQGLGECQGHTPGGPLCFTAEPRPFLLQTTHSADSLWESSFFLIPRPRKSFCRTGVRCEVSGLGVGSRSEAEAGTKVFA